MHKNGPDWFPATGHDCDGKMGQIGTEIQRMMILAESGPSNNNTQVSGTQEFKELKYFALNFLERNS